MYACGNPGEKVPLLRHCLPEHHHRPCFKKNNVPEGVSTIICGGRNVGEWMSHDTRIFPWYPPQATRMGKAVGAAVGQRPGKKFA